MLMAIFVMIPSINPISVPNPDFNADFHSFCAKRISNTNAPSNGPIIKPGRLPNISPIIDPVIAPTRPHFDAPNCLAPTRTAILSINVEHIQIIRTAIIVNGGNLSKSSAIPEIKKLANISQYPGSDTSDMIHPVIIRRAQIM